MLRLIKTISSHTADNHKKPLLTRNHLWEDEDDRWNKQLTAFLSVTEHIISELFHLAKPQDSSKPDTVQLQFKNGTQQKYLFIATIPQ